MTYTIKIENLLKGLNHKYYSIYIYIFLYIDYYVISSLYIFNHIFMLYTFNEIINYNKKQYCSLKLKSPYPKLKTGEKNNFNSYYSNTIAKINS